MQGGFPHVVAGATIEDAVCDAEKPGIVLWDASIPDAKAAAKALARAARRCRLIILAIEQNAETVIEWFSTGAKGCLSRQASTEELGG